MFHKGRVWCVGRVDSMEELAYKLTSTTWCLCTGFQFRNLLFLNDSTSEDGAAEFGVIDKVTMMQRETITFGWMTKEKALHYIKDLLGEATMEEYFVFDRMNPSSCITWSPGIRADQIETKEQHGTCRHCA